VHKRAFKDESISPQPYLTSNNYKKPHILLREPKHALLKEEYKRITEKATLLKTKIGISPNILSSRARPNGMESRFPFQITRRA
jgi:hypothetical protein